MFTGIIENIGIVTNLKKELDNLHITVKSNLTPEKLHTLMLKNRTYSLFGHSSFLVLFAFSVIYVLERNLYADSAGYIFEMLNFERLAPQVGRLSAMIPQSITLLAIKMGLSLKTIFYFHSVSYILIFYLVWLLIHYGIKNKAVGLFLILLLLLQ